MSFISMTIWKKFQLAFISSYNLERNFDNFVASNMITYELFALFQKKFAPTIRVFVRFIFFANILLKRKTAASKYVTRIKNMKKLITNSQKFRVTRFCNLYTIFVVSNNRIVALLRFVCLQRLWWDFISEKIHPSRLLTLKIRAYSEIKQDLSCKIEKRIPWFIFSLPIKSPSPIDIFCIPIKASNLFLTQKRYM